MHRIFLHKRQGYTFLDLFITIVIIAILAIGLLLLFTNMRQKARDSQRMSDVQNLKSAVEQNYSSDGEYPSTETISNALTEDKYIDFIPVDPLAK